MNDRKNRIIIANWKMNLSFNQTKQWCLDARESCIEIQKKTQSTLILCPSFDALSMTSGIFKDTPIKIGAQDCSAYLAGAHTGEVSALSLAQLGCTYTLIGHSERRTAYNESNEHIPLKASRLLENSITPILCIGETKEHYTKKITHEALEEQIKPILQLYAQAPYQRLLIAYEPVWAIGTGSVPEADYLKKVFSWLHDQCKQTVPGINVSLLYGGSVDEKNIESLSNIDEIDGFLIGGASLDFQKFNNIVSLSSI